jgi:glycosyltransferase involved in cell wall biosynthesis
MRIGFDVRYISHGLTGGVRTYVYHLARHLPAVAPSDHFVYYADAKKPVELDELPPNVTVRTLPWSSPLSTAINDRRIAAWMERDGIELAHFPSNYGPSGRYVLAVTLHDTLNLFPLKEHLRGFGKRPRQVALMAYLGWRTRQALRHADAVITISEHARQDIARRSGCPLERISAIHEAAGDEFRVITDEAALQDGRKRFALDRLVVLGDGIKNPQATLDAFLALPDVVRTTADLVFFSREPAPRPPVAEALKLPRVRFFARPSTADLVLLMNLASVFVFPSWYEGFGLPLVEAMRCGTAIIASSRGSIPEVLGGAGLLFDLEAPATLVGHLMAVLRSDSLRQTLEGKSQRRGQAFDWRVTAERTLGVYRHVLAERANLGL